MRTMYTMCAARIAMRDMALEIQKSEHSKVNSLNAPSDHGEAASDKVPCSFGRSFIHFRALGEGSFKKGIRIAPFGPILSSSINENPAATLVVLIYYQLIGKYEITRPE